MSRSRTSSRESAPQAPTCSLAQPPQGGRFTSLWALLPASASWISLAHWPVSGWRPRQYEGEIWEIALRYLCAAAPCTNDHMVERVLNLQDYAVVYTEPY